MICKSCNGELINISDWEADEIRGKEHMQNQDCYLCNFLKCTKCGKLYRIKIDNIIMTPL